MRTRYQTNHEAREKARANTKRWQTEHPDEYHAYLKQWRQDHPEEFKAGIQRWAKNNPERDKELHQRWRDEHRERWREIGAKGRQRMKERNPYYTREKSRRYGVLRLRRLGLTHGQSHISRADYRAIMARDGAVCHLCGKPIDLALKAPHSQSLAFDHVIPLIRGGPHHIDNIRPSHALCNGRKHDKLLPLA